MNFTSSNDWETENNNSKDSANVIKVNESINGSLSMKGDVDWYTFNVSASCEIAITFNHEVVDSSSTYWIIYVYDNTGVTTLLSWGRKGNTETATSDYITLSPGKYYIKVERDNYSGKNYSMVVQEKHDCQGSFVVLKASTCTEDGLREKRCNVCHKLLESENIPAEHKYAGWTIDAEASCAECGLRHHICSVCGYTSTEQIERKPHTFGEWEVISGNKLIPPIVKEKKCTLCGDVQTNRDWSYIWITILTGVAVVGALIGIINYIRAFKRR